jgi:regulator of sigma E protease
MFYSIDATGGWLLHYVVPWLVMITPIIFFHELGHFSVARFFGVKVETFSIGFGPAIAKWVDSKGTLWKISWIPIGGYVKFFGDLDAASTPDHEKLDEMPAEVRASAFPFKPLYQRALIVAAGPLANFVLAIAIFAVFLFIMGGVLTAPVVQAVTPGSPAAKAGFKAGDTITAIDGESIGSFDDIRPIVWDRAGENLTVAVKRAGANVTLHVTPRLTVYKDPLGGTEKVGQMGIESGKPHPVSYGPVAALEQAVRLVWLIVTSTLDYLWHIVTGTASSSELRGPLGTAQIAAKVAAISFLSLIRLAAFISVSIGLVNLFPIPILDGGHLLYYGCEAVLGRPLGNRAQELGFRLGLAVMLGLMVLATWNDLVRLNLF